MARGKMASTANNGRSERGARRASPGQGGSKLHVADQHRARSSLSLICPSEQPEIHRRHGSVERGVCTDVTRRGGQDGSRNQREENVRHTFSRGARRCAERQVTPATRGDSGAFLIDIWRLETAVSHWKHTMRVQSNRHGCGTFSAPIFGRENGARMGENRRAVIYSRRLRGT